MSGFIRLVEEQCRHIENLRSTKMKASCSRDRHRPRSFWTFQVGHESPLWDIQMSPGGAIQKQHGAHLICVSTKGALRLLHSMPIES